MSDICPYGNGNGIVIYNNADVEIEKDIMYNETLISVSKRR